MATTGKTNLFSLPRELRDRIYYFAAILTNRILLQNHSFNVASGLQTALNGTVGSFTYVDESLSLYGLYMSCHEIRRELIETLGPKPYRSVETPCAIHEILEKGDDPLPVTIAVRDLGMPGSLYNLNNDNPFNWGLLEIYTNEEEYRVKWLFAPEPETWLDHSFTKPRTLQKLRDDYIIVVPERLKRGLEMHESNGNVLQTVGREISRIVFEKPHWMSFAEYDVALRK
jgi:hypothetical protein